MVVANVSPLGINTDLFKLSTLSFSIGTTVTTRFYYLFSCLSDENFHSWGSSAFFPQVRPFMGSRWATQYSFFLSKRKIGGKDSRRHLDDKGRSHLFFRLGCFVSCGDPTLRDACNDVAYSTDEFALALDCKNERKVECECERMDNCATYAPHE